MSHIHNTIHNVSALTGALTELEHAARELRINIEQPLDLARLLDPLPADVDGRAASERTVSQRLAQALHQHERLIAAFSEVLRRLPAAVSSAAVGSTT
ncbi:MAG TPA: hypothetical protein VIY27_05075 [Myxococcota bacterium]